MPNLPGGTYTVAQVVDAYYNDPPGYRDLIRTLEPDMMRNENYGLLIEPYLLGQHRIKLIDMRLDGDSNIVRQLCTYKLATASATLLALATADDPEAYCRELAKPWNCENIERGRIRLDNKPEDRIFKP